MCAVLYEYANGFQHTFRQTERQTDRGVDRETDVDKQRDRKRDRQTDRQTNRRTVKSLPTANTSCHALYTSRINIPARFVRIQSRQNAGGSIFIYFEIQPTYLHTKTNKKIQ